MNNTLMLKNLNDGQPSNIKNLNSEQPSKIENLNSEQSFKIEKFINNLKIFLNL